MKIIRKSILGLFVAGGLLAASCSSETDFPVDGGNNTQILLSSKVDLQTKSSLQDVQIANGAHVGLFITKNSALSDILYSNEDLTANGIGGFGYNSQMYYPVSNENIDLYAYHPYVADATISNDLNFSVNQNQSGINDFLGSDLLFSKKLNVAKSNNVIPMVFSHKLAKLNFTIVQGNGMDLSGLSNVEIMNVLPDVTMNLNTGALSAATGTAVNVNTYGAKAITPGESEVTDIAAIITPQVFADNQRLFKIVVNGGTADEVVYYYTPTKPVSIEEGKKYNIILTVHNSGIEISSSIEDWNDGGTIIGEGTLE